ncbi:MAG: undecaprenyl/decaprenyl-phosphate alpha-N-acetylglucosaminyl 1-phosphate transferase, partial [Spirochaetales bacterium]|nr:undecaprenyl/decaprenyl-phosphate alpha-N-acetylglucosaminyl 1-phosphate transferase [Spirochaetales bacterium]
KFVVQFAAAAVLALMGYTITAVQLPWFDVTINLGAGAYVITILWLAGASNAINFIDGIDGLAGGISAIAALAYGIVFFIIGSSTSALIALALFGALIAFLLFNRPPAKIIMGDCGAIYLGFFLGSLPLLEHSGTATLLGILIPFSLLLFPVMDTLTAILRRLRGRRSIVKPDREHTHHKLLDLGFSQRQILALIYSLELLPCAAVILWAATGNDNFFWLVITSWIIMAAFFLVLDVVYHRRERTQPKPAKES